MDAADRVRYSPFEVLLAFLRSWVYFPLSNKLKYATKSSLAVAMAYLIPLSQGWEDGYTAAITVILIASIGSVEESVVKGMLRVIGTVLGATMGMILIAIFPQERILYLVAMSIVVTVILYFGRAYRGDKTIFLLTALTMMLVFKEGEVDEVFMYGINRTFMTVLGITIYTFIGVLLWPMHPEDQRSKNASKVSEISLELLQTDDPAHQKELVGQIILLERQLGNSTHSRSDTSSQMGVSSAQWRSIVDDYAESSAQLYILVNQLITHSQSQLEAALPNYGDAYDSCTSIYTSLLDIWKNGQEAALPPVWRPQYNFDVLSQMGHLQRAGIVQIAHTMERLLERLRLLAEKLNAMASPQPTMFDVGSQQKNVKFIWFDIEDIKGAAITFLVFWSAIAIWIYFNTPEGFAIAATATALTLVTTYSAARPSLLIILFTFSFIFAAAMYIFVLPHLHSGLQLGIFLFLYAFLGFYIFKPQLSIFFLLGIATLYITGDMIFNFNLFLMILLIFYLFLFILLFFNYVPFTMKPESLLLILKRRFFLLSSILLDSTVASIKGNASLWQKWKMHYAASHLSMNVLKMKFWVQRLDTAYFSSVDKSNLISFVKSCEELGYHLLVYRHEMLRLRGNPLLHKAVTSDFAGIVYSDALKRLADESSMLDGSDRKTVEETLEHYLDNLFSDIDYSLYDMEIITGFYELVSLNKNAWEKLIDTQQKLNLIDFNALKASRF